MFRFKVYSEKFLILDFVTNLEYCTYNLDKKTVTFFDCNPKPIKFWLSSEAETKNLYKFFLYSKTDEHKKVDSVEIFRID